MSKRNSTEHFGQGQSGYTAGRVEGDPSLDLEGRNVAHPEDKEEDKEDNGHIDDERFTGRGGKQWAPDKAREHEQSMRDEEDQPLVEKKVADISRSVEDADK